MKRCWSITYSTYDMTITQDNRYEREALQSGEEVDKRIRQLEHEHNLLSYKLDEWCVWPILRADVAYALENIPLGPRNMMSKIERLVLAIRDIPNLIFVRPERYLVNTYTSGLAEKEGRYYKDIWFDDLMREVGGCFKIETFNNPAFISRRRAALIKSDLTTTFFYLMSAVMARLCGSRYVLAVSRRLSSCLQNELDMAVFTSRWVQMRLLSFYWLKRLYAWLLRRVKPSYVLIADSGEYAMIAAAKEQGIKVVEIQHGNFSRHHYKYSWDASALKYKTQMPLPDRLFLYGEYWKNELNIGGFWRETLCVVGSPRMDQYREHKPAKKNDDLCTLVLTSQGIDVEKVVSFMADFFKIAEGNLRFRLFIKLHPVWETSKEVYLKGLQTNQQLEVYLGNEQPSTFELLTRSDFHLSISSSCHYEALGLGVPTVILPFATHESVLRLHKARHAFLVHNASELLDILSRRRNRIVPFQVGEYYFKNGALENMIKELKEEDLGSLYSDRSMRTADNHARHL